jgi:hypothetical protein
MEALRAKRIADLEEAPTNFKLEKGNVTTGYRMLGDKYKRLEERANVIEHCHTPF